MLRDFFRKPSRLLLLAGAAHLSRAAWQAAYSPSMDYAVVVDMARNMANGADFPTFFYGQAYMGSLEPALSAALCFLIGPHPFWVCMGSAILGIATLFAIMRFGRTLGGEVGACIALALVICAGANWTHFTVSPRGGYALASLLSLLAVYFGAVVEFQAPAPQRMRVAPGVALGLAAGLAFWNFWITLPAFAASCVMLVARYSARCLSWRFAVPATVAFFIGSAPWWFWSLHNGGGAFDMNPGVLRPPGLAVMSQITTITIPRFFCLRGGLASFWRNPFPWPLVSIAVFALLDAMISKSAQRRRLAITVVIYSLLFYLVYAFTAFGASNAARYFVHFVPAFALSGGAALGAAFQNHSPKALRWAAALILVSWGLFTAPASLNATEQLMSDIHCEGGGWASEMQAAAEDPALAQPAFADFPLFGANWVTDRRLCFASPIRWRYKPYLLRLEESESPAVINNSQAFGEFCQATLGQSRSRKIHGLDITDKILAPPELREIESDAIAAISIAGDKGSLEALSVFLDDDLSTFATLTSSSEAIDIVLGNDCEICGVSAIPLYSRRLCGIRAEIVDQGGNVSETLARCNPIGGWFWSGPRPFMFGPDSRLELRWKPRRLSRLRLVFEGLAHSSPDDRFVAAIADLRVLSNETLPHIDVESVKDAVETAKQKITDADIHAGRWLGRLIGAAPDPALTFGRDGGSLAIREVCSYASVDVAKGAVAVLRGGAADAAEATLQSMCLNYDRHDVGGCAILAIPPAQTLSDAPKLRFYGGRLFRDCSPTVAPSADEPGTITFGNGWRAKADSSLPREVSPGQTIGLVFTLAAGSNGHCDTKQPLMAFVHAVRDGKILFQGITTIDTSLAALPADKPGSIIVSVPIEVPANVKPGKATLMLCLKKPGGRLRMRPSGKGVLSSRRRAILGEIEIVAP